MHPGAASRAARAVPPRRRRRGRSRAPLSEPVRLHPAAAARAQAVPAPAAREVRTRLARATLPPTTQRKALRSAVHAAVRGHLRMMTTYTVYGAALRGAAGEAAGGREPGETAAAESERGQLAASCCAPAWLLLPAVLLVVAGCWLAGWAGPAAPPLLLLAGCE
jgi:hypothetical protein